MNEYFVAWWNVENLFSIENAPKRHEWLERYLGKELAGWDAGVLAAKIGRAVYYMLKRETVFDLKKMVA